MASRWMFRIDSYFKKQNWNSVKVSGEEDLPTDGCCFFGGSPWMSPVSIFRGIHAIAGGLWGHNSTS